MKSKSKREEWPYGYKEEQIFKSEEEKNEIMKKPDFERQTIIYKRIQELNYEKERNILHNKTDVQDKNKVLGSDSENESGEYQNDDEDYGSHKSKRKNSDISNQSMSESLSNSDENDHSPKKRN